MEEANQTSALAATDTYITAKVLPWVRLIHTMIPVLDVMINCEGGVSQYLYGDGYHHGNGDGEDQYRDSIHRKGDGTGNANNLRSKSGNGYSLVPWDGSGTVTRQ